jgi:hypothetical protein
MGGHAVFMLEADVLHDGGGPVRRRQGEDALAVRLAPQHDVVAVLPPRGGHRGLLRHACVGQPFR